MYLDIFTNMFRRNTIKSTENENLLPSVEEMKLLFENKDKIGGFTVHYYWTSETNGDKATHFGFVLGDITAVPKHHGKRIRLVRTK